MDLQRVNKNDLVLHVYNNSECRDTIDILEAEWRCNYFTRCKTSNEPLYAYDLNKHYIGPVCKYLFSIKNTLMPLQHVWMQYMQDDDGDVYGVRLAVSDNKVKNFKSYVVSSNTTTYEYDAKDHAIQVVVKDSDSPLAQLGRFDI